MAEEQAPEEAPEPKAPAKKTPPPPPPDPVEDEPVPPPDTSAAPPPAPSKQGDRYRYTGGTTLTASTDPPFTARPGDELVAASDSQAMLMSGHAEFSKEG